MSAMTEDCTPPPRLMTVYGWRGIHHASSSVGPAAAWGLDDVAACRLMWARTATLARMRSPLRTVLRRAAEDEDRDRSVEASCTSSPGFSRLFCLWLSFIARSSSGDSWAAVLSL